MANVPKESLASGEAWQPPAVSPQALRWYVAVLVCFPFLLLGGTLFWMSTAEYQEHSQYPSFTGTGYGTGLHGANCDVLVDGDSSALVGVLPRVIEARTGLKTCNIAEVAGVKTINGFLELDDYLAQNRPPRLLVFQLVPENLTNPERWGEVADFEGWFYRLRFHPDRGLLRLMVKHPEDALIAAELGLRTGLQWLPMHKLPAELAELRLRNGGRLAEPGPAFTGCPTPKAVRAPDRIWLQALRQHYRTAATQVLVDVTPVAACDATFSFYQERTGPGVTDNMLETLPLADYTATGRLHTNDAGAEVLSHRLATQIAEVVGGDAAVTQGKVW